MAEAFASGTGVLTLIHKVIPAIDRMRQPTLGRASRLNSQFLQQPLKIVISAILDHDFTLPGRVQHRAASAQV
jgi:hypothetical protein